MEIFLELLKQFVCIFIRTILDFLKIPWCQEQLRDDLFGQANQGSLIAQNALVDSLTDLGIRQQEIEASKNFIDEATMFLTGQDLCRLLNGDPIDAPTMNMIQKLADRVGIEDLKTEESIRNFFNTIGIYMPAGFCDDLQDVTSLIGSASCRETTSYLEQVRRKMLANDASDEEIQNAVDLANKNLLDTKNLPFDVIQ